jgi:hypothetical protein
VAGSASKLSLRPLKASKPSCFLRSEGLSLPDDLYMFRPFMKRLYALTAMAILRCGQCLAADVAGSKDDPSLKRIEGSEILYYKASKFDAALFALEQVEFDSGAQALKDTKVLRAEGPRTTIYYKLPPETTTLEGHSTI